MGKKHKKHKSEKCTNDELSERPLKLVLKVAGNEVTTGSPGLQSLYDEQPDHDKYKDKKKKKKKKDEKYRGSTPVSPADNKKKIIKKRKGPDPMDTDWDERSRTPAHSDVSQDKPLTPSFAKMTEKDQTPLQQALSQLIRQLQRKDPSAFFSFPVTDLIAPGYSLVIRRPMDFNSMKEKVKKELYQSLEELKERLDSLKKNIEFMAGMQTSSSQSTEDEGGTSDTAKENLSMMDTSDNSQSPRVSNRDTLRERKAEKDLEELKKMIEESGGKLSNRSLQPGVCLQNQRYPGYCPVRLGMLGVRLQTGINTLQGFKEDKRNIVTPVLAALCIPGLRCGTLSGRCPAFSGLVKLARPVPVVASFQHHRNSQCSPISLQRQVCPAEALPPDALSPRSSLALGWGPHPRWSAAFAYMNYGPFSSYAPAYDSSFSNISKDDSDLIYSFYGEENGLPESESIADYLSKSEEHMSRLADNILDALTSGDHSRQLNEPETGRKLPDDNPPIEESAEKADKPDEPERQEAEYFQQKLDETTLLLRELQKVQKERLSAKQPPNMICLLAPTAKELQIADKVTGNLAQLTSQVTPADVCSVYGVRKALGISLPCSTPQEPFILLSTVGDVFEPMEGVC
ncbi:hypothetical protein DNTS_021968 [Danionella cerebrum]|uniref:Bromo domain-containing protein n=1 Tax=Danionella cerebrum TaxID=2873325 RepID=A0A553QLN7_9TELE|nr:hypothetical protein DNTS_021968 [Danionella translucida]